MKQEILMPNYDHSILNLITTILKNYGVESKYKSIEKIDRLLKKKYKNVVLIVLDGMGENILNKLAPDGILAKNRIDTITSVYPSTTTAAMTTYYSGKPPIETGWIAWTQYFKEYGRTLDVFKRRDSYTKEIIQVESKKIEDIIGYQTIYEQINKKASNLKTYEIVPDYCDKKTKMTMIANTIQEMCESVITLCKNSEDKFIMAYHDNPDGMIHKYGCYAEEIKEYMEMIEKEFQRMLKELQNTDTLVMVSADHGHQDITEEIDILEMQDLQECLIMPPSLESRMVGFFVKPDKKVEFEKLFKQKFQHKYILYTKEEILKNNLFGYGNPHQKIGDFIGDYIAIAIADARIILGTYLSREKKKPDIKKSTHCGLTKNEMEVPLIVFEMGRDIQNG